MNLKYSLPAATAIRACGVGLMLSLLTGCATTPITVELNDGGEDRIAANDIANISIGDDIALRTETTKNMFGGTQARRRFVTGPIWKRVFIGKPDAPAKLELIATQMEELISGAGFTLTFSYSIRANMIVGDRSYPIRAKASRSAGMKFGSARRQAVELAIADAAHQGNYILTAIKKDSALSSNAPHPLPRLQEGSLQ